MEIEELTISNFRGIKGELELEPNSDNLVLVGPNGSGKSSVLAAVDFLITGQIRDLSGEGTQSITERRHGPHVDADPDEAWVEGVFQKDSERITVRRTIADRNSPTIDTDSDEAENEFESMVVAAERGLHLLSRDELLEFIVSRAGDRSDQIRTLLNIQNVQQKRRALDNAADNLAQTANQRERESQSARSDLYDLLDMESGDRMILQEVNELRREFGADPVSDLIEETFTVGIDTPSQRVVASPLLRSEGRQRVDQLQQWFDEGIQTFLGSVSNYHDMWEEVEADDEARRALEHRQLIERGKNAIDPEVQRCPLCLKSWDIDELRDHLEARLAEADELEQTLDELRSTREDLQRQLTDVRVAAEELVEILRGIDRFDHRELADFVDTISDWEEQYDGDSLSEPPKYDLSESERERILKPAAVESLLHRLREHTADRPQLDELESQYNTLRSASNRYDEMVEKSRQAAEYRRVANDMEVAHQQFIEARDQVLEDIYSQIENRIEDYYTALHADESDLDVGLNPTETGLTLGVDFYDRGQYPPHALHSEGHQDSMGICLYFALCDWLSDKETLPLIMLDDVVMSVDADHRRPLAQKMGAELDDNYQLLIATHDDMWHRHLRSSGVVSASNAVQFQGWNLEEGPQLLDEPEMEWEKIDQALDRGNISIAAHQTRRMAEWFLREACDRLDGKVPFKSNSNWTLGDFKDGTVSRYNELVRKAKSAEQSYGNNISHLQEKDQKLTEIDQRISRHGAALNPNVHYNEGETEFADCEPDELRLAVEAYRDLYNELWCDNCGSCVRVTMSGNQPESVRCNCMDISMNLNEA